MVNIPTQAEVTKAHIGPTSIKSSYISSKVLNAYRAIRTAEDTQIQKNQEKNEREAKNKDDIEITAEKKIMSSRKDLDKFNFNMPLPLNLLDAHHESADPWSSGSPNHESTFNRQDKSRHTKSAAKTFYPRTNAQINGLVTPGFASAVENRANSMSGNLYCDAVSYDQIRTSNITAQETNMLFRESANSCVKSEHRQASPSS